MTGEPWLAAAGAMLIGWLVLLLAAIGFDRLLRQGLHRMVVWTYLNIGGCYATWMVVTVVSSNMRVGYEMPDLTVLLTVFLFWCALWPYLVFVQYGLNQ